MEVAIDRKYATIKNRDVRRNVSKKCESDWEELADMCYELTNANGTTWEDTKEFIKKARKTINEGGR